MNKAVAGPDDSRICTQESAAGPEPDAPFTIHAPEPSPIPVLVAVPHAGRSYPDDIAANLRHPPASLARLEDRLVDRLAEAVCGQTGAALLVATAPRAMIDLNRGLDDMDWSMVSDQPPATQAQRPGRRARGGLGLVPRRLPGLGELWRAPIGHGELSRRIASVHAPYHERLSCALARLAERWGAALLIDLHSMPPLAGRPGGLPPARFVIGDRFGASCAGSLSSAAFDYLAQTRQVVAHNNPYAGGYVLERHSAPGNGVHAIQIEVCRSLYLDPYMVSLSQGFEATVRMISGLVMALADEVGALGRAQAAPMAAE